MGIFSDFFRTGSASATENGGSQFRRTINLTNILDQPPLNVLEDNFFPEPPSFDFIQQYHANNNALAHQPEYGATPTPHRRDLRSIVGQWMLKRNYALNPSCPDPGVCCYQYIPCTCVYRCSTCDQQCEKDGKSWWKYLLMLAALAAAAMAAWKGYEYWCNLPPPEVKPRRIKKPPPPPPSATVTPQESPSSARRRVQLAPTEPPSPASRGRPMPPKAPIPEPSFEPEPEVQEPETKIIQRFKEEPSPIIEVPPSAVDELTPEPEPEPEPEPQPQLEPEPESEEFSEKKVHIEEPHVSVATNLEDTISLQTAVEESEVPPPSERATETESALCTEYTQKSKDDDVCSCEETPTDSCPRTPWEDPCRRRSRSHVLYPIVRVQPARDPCIKDGRESKEKNKKIGQKKKRKYSSNSESDIDRKKRSSKRNKECEHDRCRNRSHCTLRFK